MCVCMYVRTYVCMYVCVSSLLAGIGVSFSQTIFTVNERDGVVAPELTLSKPSLCCLHLHVKVEDITTTSKLCVYACLSY